MPQVIPTTPRSLRERTNFFVGWLLGLFGAMATAFVVGFIMTPQRACAADFGLHLYTAHSSSTMPNGDGVRVKLHSITPGIYVHLDNGLGAGVFRNSFGDPSGWAGCVLNLDLSPRWQASLIAGGLVGYKNAPVLPALIPSVRFRLYGPHGARISYLAKKPGEAEGVHALHFTYERAL